MDVVIEEEGGRLIPVEIKAGKTIQPQAFSTLRYWQGLSGAEEGWLIYAGDEAQSRSDGMRVISWKALPV